MTHRLQYDPVMRSMKSISTPFRCVAEVRGGARFIGPGNALDRRHNDGIFETLSETAWMTQTSQLRSSEADESYLLMLPGESSIRASNPNPPIQINQTKSIQIHRRGDLSAFPCFSKRPGVRHPDGASLRLPAFFHLGVRSWIPLPAPSGHEPR